MACRDRAGLNWRGRLATCRCASPRDRTSPTARGKNDVQQSVWRAAAGTRRYHARRAPVLAVQPRRRRSDRPAARRRWTISPCSRRPAPSSAAARWRLALRALAPGAPFLVMAPKDKGGGRLAKELAELGCPSHESAKRHHRICAAAAQGDAAAIEAAIHAGAPRFSAIARTVDPAGRVLLGSNRPRLALLMRHFPEFSGRGADFGCGLGRDRPQDSDLVPREILAAGRYRPPRHRALRPQCR